MSDQAITRKKWDPCGDRRGLECRNCGCKHLRVLYTRRAVGGRLLRRRECRHCGKRLTTWELTISDTAQVADS
jgi:transcriptional regulator NrdR family protein